MKWYACSVLTFFYPGLYPTRFFYPWNFPGKNTGVSCHALLQGIFPSQESNFRHLHLPHWQEDSLLLGHLGSLSIVLDITITDLIYFSSRGWYFGRGEEKRQTNRYNKVLLAKYVSRGHRDQNTSKYNPEKQVFHFYFTNENYMDQES